MDVNRNTLKTFFLGIFSTLMFSSGWSQLLPYKNPALPVSQRVEDLLSRMTPEEKFWQCFMIPGEVKPGEEDKYRHGIFGFQVSAESAGTQAAAQLLQYNATENARQLAEKINRLQAWFISKSRLGIPVIPFDEALHGLVRSGATSFPQSIALAATFDTALMSRVAAAIGRETAMRGIRQVLSPVINLATDVRWGRTEETYGEDPFLTAAMGVAFMQPFEKMGIITTPKHFLANVGDGGRDSYPIYWSNWYLRQTHLVPFEAAFKLAGARSVMTSYNSINGIPASAHSGLLNHWLKEENQFKGFVISDAGATGGANVLHMTAGSYAQSAANAINGGLDVIFQTDYEHYQLFIPPFLDGSIAPGRLDDAVRRVLRAKFELGLFENPFVEIPNVTAAPEIKVHQALAREAAAKSVVLLKNTGVLPLQPLKRLAVIGEDAVLARPGGYSGPGIHRVSILEGLKAALPPSVQLSYAQGYSRQESEWVPVAPAYLSHFEDRKPGSGLHGAYFSQMELSGTPVFTRSDKNIDFHWTLYGPDERLSRHFYAVRWTGFLTPDTTALLQIGLDGNDGYRLFINDSLVVDEWNKTGYHTILRPYFFQRNKTCRVRIEFREAVGNGHIRLIWNKGIYPQWKQRIQEAVKQAAAAEAVVLVAGIHEGEFQDRALLSLDHHQEELIAAVAATGKPVIVLLVGGSAITMSKWLDQVQAVAMVWYPGEQGGHAVADVLLGRQNPSGRLPITFPVHEGQLPLSYWHLPTGRGNDYHNLSGEPLFPFGYGLSYTRFSYSQLQIQPAVLKAGDTATISLVVKNEGNRYGEEVVQWYLNDELASLARPVMELKGFRRVGLAPGASATVSFTVTPEMLAFLNEALKPVIEPGAFSIMVGASSKDIRLRGILTVQQ